ncbi:MAG: type II secretion system secretin GspD, partial [Pseudomonadota bacterium]
NGRITIKSGPDATVCPDEAWELFQTALRVTQATATPINGDSYKIIPIQEGARAAGPVGDGRDGDLITQIIRLKHIDAREAVSGLAQIISERGVVTPVRSGNAIILVDVKDNSERIRKVLSQIDRDTTVYRTISLEYASALEVSKVVTNLAREISEESGGQGSNISVVPVEASNSILIRAEPTVIGRLASVVSELDRIGETKSDLSVIALDHADAEEMAPLLREIANAQPASPGAEGGPVATTQGQRATISFHKPTNSVIISGDANIQQTLRNVVAQLDVRRAQVLVEAIIVNISEDTARELGLQYLVTGNGENAVPFSATSFSSAQTNLLSAAGSSLIGATTTTTTDADGNETTTTTDSFFNNPVLEAALGSLLGLNGFALGGAGQSGDTIFAAVLTAIQDDMESQILSLPSVLTLDNQTAELSIGQEIPITTGEAIGDDFSNAFRTVSREEVGVILNVTPKINEGGTVTLDVEQETSSVAGQIINTSTDLITNKSAIKTTALVDDGDVLVLGGLIEQTDEINESKVPLLGDVPVLGNLFKTTGRTRDRSNLVVFIKPTIIRSRDDARTATQRKMDYIKARELMRSDDAVSELDRLIYQVTGAPEGDVSGE